MKLKQLTKNFILKRIKKIKAHLAKLKFFVNICLRHLCVKHFAHSSLFFVASRNTTD